MRIVQTGNMKYLGSIEGEELAIGTFEKTYARCLHFVRYKNRLVNFRIVKGEYYIRLQTSHINTSEPELHLYGPHLRNIIEIGG